MLMRSTLGAVIRHTASLANKTITSPTSSRLLHDISRQHQDQKLHRQQAGLPGRQVGALNFIDFKSAKSEHTAVTSDLRICKSANLNMQQSLQFFKQIICVQLYKICGISSTTVRQQFTTVVPRLLTGVHALSIMTSSTAVLKFVLKISMCHLRNFAASGSTLEPPVWQNCA
jgi:hypothetical protein